MKPRRKRRRFHVGSSEFRVQLVPASDPRMIEEDGSLIQGHTFYDECLVLIRDDLAMEVREEVFMHELEHIVNKISGAEHEMGLRFRNEKKREEHEERIVRARTPHMHRALKDLGFRIPRGLLT